MLHQNYDNRDAIAKLQNGSEPYYWVNVGVEKYFTGDLTEASVYYNSVGDSLYKCNPSIEQHWGELVLITEGAPEAYSVEVELFAADGHDDSDQPENWISPQYGQMDAMRVFRNAQHIGTLRNVYSAEGLAHTDHAMVRLVRNGAGTVDYCRVVIPEGMDTVSEKTATALQAVKQRYDI